MPKEILKNLVVKSTCKNCRKTFTTRAIVSVKTVSVDKITNALLATSFYPKKCKKCSFLDFTMSYTFYHEEKINNTIQS